jgi:hypothetical protein
MLDQESRTPLRGVRVSLNARLREACDFALPQDWERRATLPCRRIGLDRVISSKPARESQLSIALIVLRIISPGSKRANLTSLQPETAKNTLAEELQLNAIEPREIYEAMDWLLSCQNRIETKLAKKHLAESTLVLDDVSSSYDTRRQSSLIQFGYSRDGKQHRPQIVYGLICNADGCPIAIEVSPGNTAAPTSFTTQVEKIRQRFSMNRVVLVGDRGMITSKLIDENLRGVEGIHWITALRRANIKMLVESETISSSLFDEKTWRKSFRMIIQEND